MVVVLDAVIAAIQVAVFGTATITNVLPGRLFLDVVAATADVEPMVQNASCAPMLYKIALEPQLAVNATLEDATDALIDAGVVVQGEKPADCAKAEAPARQHASANSKLCSRCLMT